MSIEEMVDGEDVTRRDMLRKTAIGAGLGAAAIAAPSIAGVGIAPAFGQASSACVAQPGVLDLTVTQPGGAMTSVTDVAVNPSTNAAPNCTATVVIEPLGIAQNVNVDVTGSGQAVNPITGAITTVPITGRFNTGAGGSIVVPVPCGETLTVVALSGNVDFFGTDIPLPIVVDRSTPVIAC